MFQLDSENKLLINQGLRRCTVCKDIKKLNIDNFSRDRYNAKYPNSRNGFLYKCHPCYSKYLRDKRESSPERYAKYKAQWVKRQRKLRTQVLSHYGSRCACCGEDTYEFLAIDHINNDGHEQRKKIKGYGTTQYTWIVKNNYPTDLQVLCHNCNMAKSFYKGCPHKK